MVPGQVPTSVHGLGASTDPSTQNHPSPVFWSSGFPLGSPSGRAWEGQGARNVFFSGGCACSGAQRSNLQNVSAGSWRRGERLHTCLTYARIPLLGEAPGTAWGPSGGSMVTANTLFELRECCTTLVLALWTTPAAFGRRGERLPACPDRDR